MTATARSFLILYVLGKSEVFRKENGCGLQSELENGVRIEKQNRRKKNQFPIRRSFFGERHQIVDECILARFRAGTIGAKRGCRGRKLRAGCETRQQKISLFLTA
jgi:hypothetical protein